MPIPIHRLVIAVFLAAVTSASAETEPLHRQIDDVLKKSTGGLAVSEKSADAEFLRRVSLDFAGDIPDADTVRSFLADSAPDKRTKLIGRLLDAPRYAEHMADQFSILLMERRGENPHWRQWLVHSFGENKPWDRMVREILRADYRDEANRGAAFFYSMRLEKYGANDTDYPGLTRDVGRLFLGIDLQCAECHDHRTVEGYKQADFQGLYATFSNINLHGAEFPAVEEGVIGGPLEFASVFNQKKKTTGPRIPGLEEIAIEAFEKETAFLVPPDKKAKTPGIPRFSPLSRFAEQMPESPNFGPSIANRIWFLMIGRGIVEPLDLFHADNPPSHPELLSLLGSAFAEGGYDIKNFLREIALTEVYQRSGHLPETGGETAEKTFTSAFERRLSAEQLSRMLLTATGNTPADLGEEKAESLRKKIHEAFEGEPKEPELGFEASLEGTLLFLNDEEFASLLKPSGNNLAARLGKETDGEKLTEELFVHVLSRPPVAEDREEIIGYLKDHPGEREQAIEDLIWALLTSTEFATNH